jgi:hypothetical protein
MVKKLECIHCRKKYLAVVGGPTTTLKRHIQQCACIKRAKGKKKKASLILNHARVLMQPVLIIQVAVMIK